MRRLAILTLALAVVVVLGVGQLVLPGIAAQSLRDRLSGSGQVLEVGVHAVPAIELLWHQAGHVVVALGRYRSSSSQVGTMLDQTGSVDRLDVSVRQLDTGLLTLRNATLHKQGSVLTASAKVTEADLRSALPILQTVSPVASGHGQLILQGTATLLGITATVDAEVRASNGSIVVAPDVPFGALATVTVFSDPHLEVQSVGASPVPSGFSITATGRLH